MADRVGVVLVGKGEGGIYEVAVRQILNSEDMDFLDELGEYTTSNEKVRWGKGEPKPCDVLESKKSGMTYIKAADLEKLR